MGQAFWEEGVYPGHFFMFANTASEWSFGLEVSLLSYIFL